MKPIADTGVIVALLAADDPAHAWAAAAFQRHSPFYTCDAVVAEACSFFPDARPVLTLVVRMTEQYDRCKVWTVDRGDYVTYRRHGRQPVPCEFPPKD